MRLSCVNEVEKHAGQASGFRRHLVAFQGLLTEPVPAAKQVRARGLRGEIRRRPGVTGQVEGHMHESRIGDRGRPGDAVGRADTGDLEVMGAQRVGHAAHGLDAVDQAERVRQGLAGVSRQVE